MDKHNISNNKDKTLLGGTLENRKFAVLID